ncbi:uncharacterized protein LOC132717646 [Ruditapes philippinarum]|uniref:uncharacterized protein LOC132717646 n=1 Tax=Ruditapes philippinarum TaxID=129788 RepID=UPI00295AEA71|nr:uncharacterized protein LOC132717646 [Ruditapes philippinarum]XP_060557144.1 uncharacterized protein LOC132717646 [Ruditapes philippinarum]XP_060557145.1 uncharacterized protein LOC132717646 [Ruditapes philippinarum]XP_060557146.1 uncharacterized protein LOC132717646 [Ruditapes philippinarum]XP_060557147.1 uncharacterized protein LOC132717646 [Ruditapes philippinarum]
MDSYNDDIELLKQSPDENREDSTTSQLDSSLNPLDVIKRARYSDESIDQAPILALQTAFTSLQKIHNDEVQKNKKLIRENQSMKKALMDATQGNQPRYENQDMYDTQVAHAAGGTSEDESLAENRAIQGHVSHLERELLITTNAVQKGNEEILILKNNNEMLEEKVKKLLRKNEEFHSDNVEMSETLKNLNDEVGRKNLEIAQMKNALQSEQELNHNLKLKLESSQEQIDTLQRTGYSGQSEVQNLKLKLTQLESDLRKSYSASQFRELERKLKESEESKGVLEAKCKQLEIECNIRSEQRQQEDSDDVDGDVETLKKALGILRIQQEEVKELKGKIEEQHKIIIQIQSTGKKHQGKSLDVSTIRPEAQGSSFNPYQEHVYENHSDLHQNTQFVHSPLSRRQSDKGDYRSQGPKTSPRVEDKLRPTGQLTHMVAMESHMDRKPLESAGAFQSSTSPNRNRSPGENTYDSRFNNNIGSKGSDNMFVRPSVSGSQPTFAQQNVRSSVSPRNGNGHEPYTTGFTESPRISNAPSVSNNQVFLQSNSQETAYVQAGARPRVSTKLTATGYANHFESQEFPLDDRLKPQQKIPDRMTQSEIIVKNRPGLDNSQMTRSVLDPLRTLEIPQATSNYRQNDFVHGETSAVRQNLLQQSANEQAYQNDFREQYDIGPDYENIYNANAQTETKRPIEEHEDTVFTTANERGFNIITNPVQEETGDTNVAAVKICPVCNEECSRLTLDQFQMHVVECFDNNDESPATLQPAASGKPQEEDRTCPMCEAVFPVTIPQESYEQHVLAHFGEDPHLGRFEMLQ